MISSFKFINHIVLCHLAHPHESIQSPRSSQCRAPPLRTHINQRCVPSAPDHRSPHFSIIATSHWLHPQVSRYTPSPSPTLLSVLIRLPSPYYPMPSSPSSPSSWPGPSGPLWWHPPVSHTFRFCSKSTAYSGSVIHCASHRAPSVLPPSSRPV